MNEQDRFKVQLIKHMIYNIIAFSIIFLMFGFIACFMIKNLTFSSVDIELKESANTYIENQSNFNNFNNFSKNWFNDDNPNAENPMNDVKDYMLARKVSNPNIIVILRDNDNNVLNENDLGRNYNQYLANISFNQSILNKIYTIRINNKYNYRAINVKLDAEEDEDIRYVQLLINVDSEMELISHYFDIIIILILFGIATSIIASYILSKKTLIPIAETLEKQTEFVQNASHELRTPLTIIQAKQELLLQEPNARIIDKSEDIVLTLNETKRMTKLTKDLMILARADDKRLTVNKEKVDIDNFIEELAKPYIEIAELDNKKLELKLEYNEEASIDTNKIYQVLVILLDNAIKYTEQGDSIEIVTKSESGKCVIEVKDTGIGISEEGIKHIFDRFYREDKARNRETGGSGLGLSIADAIVKSHGGTIRASHNEPKGTIFTIRLPK
jgi:two-component system sensor histidine kinase CiaH